MTADTWPTDRPGYPLRAERDGWHWIATLPNIVPTPWRWWPDSESDGGGDWRPPGSRWATPLRNMQRYHYLGPCYTQADLDAAVQAERAIADRLACAAEAMPRATPAPGDSGTPHQFMIEAGVVWELDAALKRFRARGPTSALDAAVTKARADGEQDAIKLVAKHLEGLGLKPFWVRSVLRLAEPTTIRSAAAGEEGK